MSVEIKVVGGKADKRPVVVNKEVVNIRTPGELITADTGFMRGHGTYVKDDKLIATVAGVVEKVNKLICVRPLKSRYNGEVGDVVIARILEVCQRRWKIDTKSRLDSVLMLSSVNLPGGELRRKTEEDERLMRDYLVEGDLISAEVQSVLADGALSLHTRSLKYGKLGQGVLINVPPGLVLRRKTHFHNLPCGCSIILGNNGYIWISVVINEDTDNTGGFEQNLEPVSIADREVMIRVRNCVLALASEKHVLFDTSILYAFEASQKYQVKELLKPDISKEIADVTRQRLEQEM